MSKALELAGELEDKVENPFEYSLETMANAASELRRLAQIERKYNEIMAQEPVAWLFQHEETGQEMIVENQQVEWGFEKNNPRLQKIYPIYTLKKD